MAIKKVQTFALAVLASVAGAGTLQAQKAAYVASEAILERLPDAKSARAKLSELQMGWMREIQRQEQEIAKLRTDIETNRLLWSTQERRDADSRLADLEGKLTTYRSNKFGPRQEFERQQTELMGPIIDRVGKAIEDEARAQKYDFVFDKSSRGMPMLYANPSNDITWAVLKRLGVDVDTAGMGGAGGARVDGDARTEEEARRNRGGRREIPVDPNKLLTPDNPILPPAGSSSGTDSGGGTTSPDGSE